jgi:peroxidase
MNHASRDRQVSRKARAVRRRRTRPLCLEPLEERCQPSVTGFSSVDEVGNNAANLGIAGTDLLRLSPADYKPVANGGDGLTTPSLTYGAPTFVAGPRLVSNVVSNQATTLFGPTDINTVDQNGLSDFGYTWGQFIDHDMDLTPTQSTGAPAANKDGVNGFPIPVDPTHTNDPIHVPGQPDVNLAFTRSIFDPATGNPGPDGITGTADDVPRQQINVSTSFLDLSQVYGSTLFVSDALRTHSGGLLKSSPGVDGIVGTADDLLPFNTTANLPYNNNQPYFTQAQLDAFGMANDAHLVPSDQLFVAGDPRANETTELTSLQTLFLRNHNAIARQLATLDPAQFGFTSWSDDNLFQEARKLNIAIEQNIIYTGYLPDLLGPSTMPAYTGYNAGADPSISTEFSTVGFRFGHSLLNNTVARDANDGSSVGDIGLAISFFNPTLLTPGGVDFFGNHATDIGAILKGDADNNAQALDVMAVSSIRNLLFGQGGQGEDLIARDIWRADDHGIGTYNQVRVAFGLAPITDTGESAPGILPGDPSFRFHGFEQISSDPAVVQKLITAFTGPSRDTVPGFLSTGHFAGDINPFIAGLAEDHVPGSDLGPLFTAILRDQFSRLATGDRFFYLNETFNSAEQAILSQGSTLGKVITANTGVTNLQADVFRFLAQENGQEKGFYAGKDGQAALTGSRTGTTLTTDLYNNLVAALDPDNTGQLALVDANGNHLPDTFLQSYSNVQSYLKSKDGSIALKLSLQLLTTEFNVLLGKVDATTSIFVPAVTIPDTGANLSSTLQSSLQTHGVSNPSGIANIQDLLTAAIGELNATTHDSTFQEALKDCLDGINNNEAIFILK